MDFSGIAIPGLTWDFFVSLCSIVIIDLILAGDNAVVIAMAVRGLPAEKRRLGIILGAGAAVVLRVVLTFFAALLLGVSFVKLAGGLLICWIAVKLFVEGCPEEGGKKPCATVWQATSTIIVADLVMSTDNVLAVAGASRGDPWLLIFGLGLSIPFVVFTSGLLARLMDSFPVVVYLGAAVLGKVAGEMILSDPWVLAQFHPSHAARLGAEMAFAAGVIVTGLAYVRLTRGAQEQPSEACDDKAECPVEVRSDDR